MVVAIGTMHSVITFDLTPLNIAVTTGDVLFAALEADFFGGMFSTVDLYAGGLEFGCGPAFGIARWTQEAEFGVLDLMFQSFVDAVPAPGRLALFGLGLAAIRLKRRR